jgi:predicted phosphodiesterase
LAGILTSPPTGFIGMDADPVKKIAIISDIHSNIYALQAAIACIRKQNVDRIIFQGDLLTYGCHPNEVIEELVALEKEFPLHFLLGNHDEIYFNLQNGGDNNFDYAQDFVKESIYWTLDHVKFDLKKKFPWENNFIVSNIFVSHANPGKDMDWTYIRTSEDKQLALSQLEKNSFKLGVFGHVHRHGLTLKNGASISDAGNEYQFRPGSNEIGLAMNYSIGQPRGDQSGLLYLQFSEEELTVSFETIVYPLDSHLKAIMDSSLSQSTKTKLRSYFRRAA